MTSNSQGSQAVKPTPQTPPVSRVLFALGESVPYVLLRGIDELCIPTDKQEVDLLVSPENAARALAVIREHGYLEIAAWGHAPHRFFVNYFPNEHSWVKLDVVTSLMYGRPTRHLQVEHELLRHRVRIGEIFIPCASDELSTLLLHCMLDKAEFRQHHCERIVTLYERLKEMGTQRPVMQVLEDSLGWPDIESAIQQRDFDWLLTRRKSLARWLRDRQRLSAGARLVSQYVLGKIRPAIAAATQPGMALAIIAPDGGGKTTLATRLCKVGMLETRYAYSGQSAFASEHPHKRTVLRFLAKLVRQWKFVGKAGVQRLTGKVVVFDRYVYDRWVTAPVPKGTLRILRDFLLRSCWPTPDLVIILDAPGRLLYERKHEHSEALLEQHRAGYKRLALALPQATVIDGSQPFEQVEREFTSIVWNRYREMRA